MVPVLGRQPSSSHLGPEARHLVRLPSPAQQEGRVHCKQGSLLLCSTMTKLPVARGLSLRYQQCKS